ncbi:hypothetical protein D3C75_550330 [compost metagenome]
MIQAQVRTDKQVRAESWIPAADISAPPGTTALTGIIVLTVIIVPAGLIALTVITADENKMITRARVILQRRIVILMLRERYGRIMQPAILPEGISMEAIKTEQLNLHRSLTGTRNGWISAMDPDLLEAQTLPYSVLTR